MTITKEQENEFSRICDSIIAQGDIDCLTDIIPDKLKVDFINSYNEGAE